MGGGGAQSEEGGLPSTVVNDARAPEHIIPLLIPLQLLLQVENKTVRGVTNYGVDCGNPPPPPHTHTPPPSIPCEAAACSQWERRPVGRKGGGWGWGWWVVGWWGDLQNTGMNETQAVKYRISFLRLHPLRIGIFIRETKLRQQDGDYQPGE